MPEAPRTGLIVAWTASLIATAGSLNYSGVGFLGFDGMGLFPCELCWFQRILMYPLTVVLAVVLFRDSKDARRIAWILAGVGALLSSYHSLIERRPSLEVAQCGIGTCTAIQYTVLGLSIPNQALLAFAIILAGLAWEERRDRRTAAADEPETGATP